MPTRKKTAHKKTAARKAPKASPKVSKPSQLDRIENRLALVESSLAVLRSGATFMQELDKAAPQPIGLSPGDYTDASNETADALTAMGWEWWDDDRHKEKYIRFGQNSAKGKMVNINQMGATCHLTPAEFLSRASVTAKELRLVPVAEKWVPAPGEWVRDESCIGKAVEVDRGLVSIDIGPKNVWRLLKRVAKPTDAEVQQHLAEQEAKANAEKLAKLKAMKPGTPIKVKGKKQCTFIALERECLVWYAHYEDESYYAALTGASDITVIEQP